MPKGMITIRENGEVSCAGIPVQVLVQGSQVVVYSLALELGSCGDNREQAFQNFQDAVQIFIEDLIEQGHLEEVLEELGWERTDNQWVPPAWECNQYTATIDNTSRAV